MSRFRATVLTLAFTLSACGKDGAVTTPPPPGVSDPVAGTVAALVDDSSYMSGSVSVRHGGGLLRVTAIGWGMGDDRVYLDLILETTVGSAPQSIGPGKPAHASYLEEFFAGWLASGDLGSGTITLTSLTEDRATGAFNFTSQLAYRHFVDGRAPVPVRVVRNGQFSVRLR